MPGVRDRAGGADRRARARSRGPARSWLVRSVRGVDAIPL